MNSPVASYESLTPLRPGSRESAEQRLKLELEDWDGGNSWRQMGAMSLLDYARGTGEKILDLGGANLDSLPPGVFEKYPILFQNLEHLNLSSNSLTSIPEDIRFLPNLKSLDLSSNKITSIDFPHTLDNLEELQLGFNNIGAGDTDDLKVSHNWAPRLELLDLRGNDVKSATGLVQFPGLSYLDLSLNELDVVPGEIANLTNLETLYLQFNSIEIVPGFLAGLSRLTDIVLNDNSINWIEAPVYGLMGRVEFYLDRNPITRASASTEPNLLSEDVDNLEEQLETWKNHGHWQVLPSLEVLTVTEKSIVSRFISRLCDTQDFKLPGGPGRLASRLHNLLCHIGNRSIADIVVPVLDEGLGACGDRVITYFDEANLAIRTKLLVDDISIGAGLRLAEIARGYLYLEKITRASLEKAKKLKEEDREYMEENDEPDTVGIRLSLQLALKKDLNLPIETSESLFDPAVIYKVTPDDVERVKMQCLKTEDEEHFKFLKSWEPWQTWLAGHYEAKFAEVAGELFETPEQARNVKESFYANQTRDFFRKIEVSGKKV